MPSRAPTYYHWAVDKPVTTNETYGYFARESTNLGPAALNVSKKEPRGGIGGPFDYTRPFSASGFFPEIAYRGRLNSSTLPRPLRPSKDYNPPSIINRFDINRGYTMGPQLVHERVVKSDPPVGCNLIRSVSAPTPGYRYPTSKSKDIYLWHTLSGCLVHAKNYPPVPPVAEKA